MSCFVLKKTCLFSLFLCSAVFCQSAFGEFLNPFSTGDEVDKKLIDITNDIDGPKPQYVEGEVEEGAVQGDGSGTYTAKDTDSDLSDAEPGIVIADDDGAIEDLGAEEVQELLENQKILGVLRGQVSKFASTYAYDPGYFISPVFSLSILQPPFTVGLGGGLEFIDSKHIGPFFFGGGLQADFGIPKNPFSYTYTVDGNEIMPPYLASLTAYAPFGIFYGPFKNPNLAFEMTARLGLRMSGIVSFEADVASDFHCSLYTAMSVGFDFYRVNCQVIFAYDTIGEFIPSFNFSYRVKLKRFWKTKAEIMNEK